ncbi:hypothetical protein LSH36_207g03020 [Paralvinella palmiformis]|uniref:Uncharacterized protein n=1 Tax=Paralvinella palmiformis TaxID=53620 RepID=A0AAD9N6C2_9ANNE|nr:hypothetical protein LSH36_207g03020 [Paralvinella palmiformis]
MMSTNHSFHKSTKCLYQISRVQKHHQHSCFKKLKMSRSNSRHSPPRQPILRVLIDMDGVLCDFEQSFLDKFRERHPDEPYIPLSERKGFYIDEQYAKMKPNLQEKTCSIIETEGFFRDLSPVDGALDAIKSMSSIEGFFEWVEHHLGWNWINKIIITKDKTIISGDLLIDDKPVIKGDQESM